VVRLVLILRAWLTFVHLLIDKKDLTDPFYAFAVLSTALFPIFEQDSFYVVDNWPQLCGIFF